MSKELSQNQLERLVVGEQPDPNATFYEKAVMDAPASREAKRRIYVKELYIKLTQPGVRDWVAYKATPADIKKYAEAYQYFLNNRQGAKAPGVEIIPNLDMAHLQELIDYGLSTIPKLAEAEMVPPHLEYAREAAIKLNSVLQESNDGEEENREEIREAQDVSAPSRREHATDVGQPELLGSDGSPAGDVAQRIPPGRPEHGGQDLNHWNVELRWVQ